jgi:hypothetical protein
MEVLRLVTDDYELTVRAEGVIESFRRSSLRNTNIVQATQYIFTGADVRSFELATCEETVLTKDISIGSLNVPSHPVFFENKDYYFDIVFNEPTVDEPLIYTTLEEIRKAFISRKVKNNYFLTGAVNYGNDLGKTDFVLRYKKNGNSISHKLSFEVFPVKLDYKSDYKSIITEINQEFSSLVFDILKKTWTGFNEGNEVNNDIIWWGIFGQLYKSILFSSKLILNKPHNRLIKDNYYSKADRIKVLSPALEEQVRENRENPQKYYRVERKTLTSNTLENQFLKHAISHIQRKFVQIKDKLTSMPGFRITEMFVEELNGIEKDLASVAQHPFFKQIDEFKGMKQESLVLQKASGYSSLFRSWIILKKGIDFLEGINQIELKNIAELYQIWCFIEMKNMVQDILNKNPEEVNLAEILIDGFTIQLRSGRNSRVSFRKENGDLVELFHELKYTGTLTDNTKIHTVAQEPDIVLKITKNDLSENLKFTYLFDAKYRIDDTKDKDHPPEDTINQMHRYRDAIYYQETQDDKKPKKEVIGAYVLFPSSDISEDVSALYFQKSIEKVNIGAFPLLPGTKKFKNNALLTTFLRNTLEVKESIDILDKDVNPYKGLKYEEADAYVLAGFVSSSNQKEYFRSNDAKVYHMPVNRKKGSQNTIKNLDKLKYFSPIVDGVRDYYEISEITVEQRRDIFPIGHSLYADSTDSYYVFSLRNKKVLNKSIESAVGGNRVFRYARLSELRSASTINDFNKCLQEAE